MRSHNLLSFGIGLSGLGVAVGSVCRPRTTGSSLYLAGTDTASLIAETTSASSTFPETSLSPTAVTGLTETFTESTATAFETTVAVTTSEILRTISTEAATIFEDTSLPTTEATTLQTSVAVTTSTLAETTTTPELPYPTLFDLSASTGRVAGRTLHIEPIQFKAPYFIRPDLGQPSSPLSWDPKTGHLILSDTLSICVAYTRGRQTAQLKICLSNDVAADYLICDAPTGANLQCRVRACTIEMRTIQENPRVMALVKECHDEQEPWTHFYTRKEWLSNSWNADIGPGGISDPNLTSMELRITEA
ncbi:hypothetical protein NW768_004122 [Fusarium equiseti]|uniref:Ricin B lectin domain-containing protein n=1 Tax=Fusarium equiseti TaxID=61235 RepID=A0ABQ8RJN1_FUSEQ|nr:hypothetical protein NW768_004122 [Fusarium equiseti]